MKGFHMLVMLLCTQQIQDTQCGFKLFTHSVATKLFGNLHLFRWAFDIELIYQAEALGIPMKEVFIPNFDFTKVDNTKLIYL
jgi:dolichyl-phosphate beta-glucosyltransferase